jgi:hypothetical protein
VQRQVRPGGGDQRVEVRVALAVERLDDVRLGLQMQAGAVPQAPRRLGKREAGVVAG